MRPLGCCGVITGDSHWTWFESTPQYMVRAPARISVLLIALALVACAVEGLWNRV